MVDIFSKGCKAIVGKWGADGQGYVRVDLRIEF